MTRAMSETRPEAPGARRELRYEGFPLEAVLARVHTAHGADVTITGADRVRRGGIGGFFARELFQVTVLVPEAPDPGDDGLNFVPLGRLSIFDDPPVVLGDEPAEFGDDEIDPEDIAGAMSLAPAPRRDDADAEIWALLAAAATATPTVEPAPRTEPSDVLPPALAAGLAAGLAATAPVAARDPELTAPEIVAPIQAAGPIASTTLIPASSVVGTPFDPALAAPARASTAPVPISTALAPSPEGVASGLAVPAEAIRAARRVDLPALLARFEAAPSAPDLPSAGIVAVIGARHEALETAGRLAERLGVPTDDVIVASPPADVVLPTPDEAMRLAATTRYRCAPVAVIVLELVPGRQGHEWVRVVLDGLRAEQVRLAADTTRFLAHQHLSIAAVGGVDVIDLLGTTSHPSPADALDLPTPVGSLDGRPATPELWAATVLASPSVSAPTVDRSGVIGR